MTPPPNFKFSHITDCQEVWVPEDDPKSATVWVRPDSSILDNGPIILIDDTGIHFATQEQVKAVTEKLEKEFSGTFKLLAESEAKETAAPTSGEGERG